MLDWLFYPIRSWRARKRTRRRLAEIGSSSGAGSSPFGGSVKSG